MTKRTALYEDHRQLGAKFVEFGGWDMPVQYSSIKEEHQAVRTQAGIFDVSHMGEVWVTGPNAAANINNWISNDVEKIPDGKAIYTVMLYDDGGCVDDLIVYRESAERFLICLNASNATKDIQWIRTNKTPGCEIEDVSEQTGLISIQGPLAATIIDKMAPQLSHLKAFQWQAAQVAGIAVHAARTGYTGEDGFEFFHDRQHSSTLWQALLNAGAKPCGLGARDTLRLEAALPLYGHELNDTRSPLDANLQWVYKMHKPKFIGKAHAVAHRPTSQLVGLVMTEPGIARQGYPVGAMINNEWQITGEVTSGSPSPTTGKNIALAYIKISHKEAPLGVLIRDKWVKAQLTTLPFVPKKPKK